jgi:hypothetical protein
MEGAAIQLGIDIPQPGVGENPRFETLVSFRGKAEREI